MTLALTHLPTTAPVACSLSAQEQGARAMELQELLDGQQELRELPNGYALRFPGEEAWAERLLAFIAFERRCCPFITFALVFAPEQGPLWLHLQGPAGTKEWLSRLLAESGLRPTPTDAPH